MFNYFTKGHVTTVFLSFLEPASDTAKIFMLTPCVYVFVCFSIPCMVLSYVRPHSNLSTCATSYTCYY